MTVHDLPAVNAALNGLRKASWSSRFSLFLQSSKFKQAEA
jgi:hypothetical protein